MQHQLGPLQHHCESGGGPGLPLAVLSGLEFPASESALLEVDPVTVGLHSWRTCFRTGSQVSEINWWIDMAQQMDNRGFHSRPTLVPTLIQTCGPTSTKLKWKLANSTMKHLELQKTQGWDQVGMICAWSPFRCRFLPILDVWEVGRWSWAQSWDQSWENFVLPTWQKLVTKLGVKLGLKLAYHETP